jgi:hypothetical protein
MVGRLGTPDLNSYERQNAVQIYLFRDRNVNRYLNALFFVVQGEEFLGRITA